MTYISKSNQHTTCKTIQKVRKSTFSIETKVTDTKKTLFLPAVIDSNSNRHIKHLQMETG